MSAVCVEKPSVLACPLPATRHPTLEENLVDGMGVGKHSGKRDSLLSIGEVALQRSCVSVRSVQKPAARVFTLLAIWRPAVTRGPLGAMTERAPAACLLLALHHRTCGGEMPCAGHTCGKAFSQGSRPTRHHRSHTAERPYECCACGKAFGGSSHLIRHQKIHSGSNLSRVTNVGKLSVGEELSQIVRKST